MDRNSCYTQANTVYSVLLQKQSKKQQIINSTKIYNKTKQRMMQFRVELSKTLQSSFEFSFG